MAMTMSQPATLASARNLTILEILFLHLAPGVVVTATFVALAWLTAPFGWPPSLALLLAWLLAGIPVLCGILLAQGYRRNGTWSLSGVLGYREPLSRRSFAGLVSSLLVWTALASTVLFPVGEFVRVSLFADWPAWLNLSTLAQNPAQYSNTILWIIVILSAVLNIAVPIVEELYFRSFLLPRLPVSGRWAPLLSTVLFALYHFWLPWDIAGRIVALLPVVYAVQWKHNVYLSIWVHCLLNLLGTIGLAVLVLSH